MTVIWIQSRQSKGVIPTSDVAVLDQCSFEDRHLAFMDADSIWLELERFKNERAWFNLNLSRQNISDLLERHDWYTLYIPTEELEFRTFGQVREWQEIATACVQWRCTMAPSLGRTS